MSVNDPAKASLQRTKFADTSGFGQTYTANLATDSEFGRYDRVRSSEAHVILDFQGEITPVGYFEKFSCKSKTEIIYRQPIGAKVPIGERKEGGWDLNFSSGLISDELWQVNDTYQRQKFVGLPSPRIDIAQRVHYNAPILGATGTNLQSTTAAKTYLLLESIVGGYEINDPGNGDPIEISASGYSRFRIDADNLK